MSLYFCFPEVHRWTDKEIKNIIRDVFGHSVLVRECKRQWISHQGLNTLQQTTQNRSSSQVKLLTHTVLNLFYSATFFCIVYRINSIHLHKKELIQVMKETVRIRCHFFFKCIITPKVLVKSFHFCTIFTIERWSSCTAHFMFWHLIYMYIIWNFYKCLNWRCFFWSRWAGIVFEANIHWIIYFLNCLFLSGGWGGTETR